MGKLLQWSDDLNIGIDEIDRQHCRILDFINHLYQASEENDTDKLTMILEGIIGYTESHFSFEEEMLYSSEYPAAETHMETHGKFVNRMNSYKDRLEKGENIAHNLSTELMAWLTHHIKNEDQLYVPYITKHDQDKNRIKSMLSRHFNHTSLTG